MISLLFIQKTKLPSFQRLFSSLHNNPKTFFTKRSNTYSLREYSKMEQEELVNVGTLLSACIDAAQKAGGIIRKVSRNQHHSI